MMRRDSFSTRDGFIPGGKEFTSLNDPRPTAEAKPASDYGEPMVAHVNPILPDDTVTGRSLPCGHHLAETEQDAIAAVRSFLSYLPSNWQTAPPAAGARGPAWPLSAQIYQHLS